jgi:ABC-type arginine transport system permease subunit
VCARAKHHTRGGSAHPPGGRGCLPARPALLRTHPLRATVTSLGSTILVTELLRVAQVAAAPTFKFLQLYGVAAVYDWIICLVPSFAQSRLETRLDRFVAT